LGEEEGRASGVEFSPDGKWLAYESTSGSSGPFEVYVRPFPELRAKRMKLSMNGGQHPLWAPSGRELFYIAADGMMMSVPIELVGGFSHGSPVPLFQTRQYYPAGQTSRNYDFHPNRFLFAKNDTTRIRITLNWFEELKRLVPTD
jgi:Tol biopolymer transport system component